MIRAAATAAGGLTIRRRTKGARHLTDEPDRAAAIPLYHQIFLRLRDEVLAGLRPFGSTVPTEMELAQSCAVSRITARRALAELAAHGLVARRRRVGTTVVYRPPAKPIEAKMDQAVDSLLGFGRSTRVRVLALKRERAQSWVAESLRLAAGDPVLRAERVRYLEGEPLGYVVSYVPAALASHVTRRGLARQPILALIQEAGYRLGKASQVVAATLADPLLCRTLQVEPRSAVLRITRAVFDAADRPLLLTIAHYRSDRYQLRLDLQH